MKQKFKRWLIIILGKLFPQKGNRVLCFHEIRDSKVFFRKMKWLKQHYNVVGLEKILKEPNTHRNVALTFDDGFQSWFTKAVPILRELNMPAVFFVNSGVINLKGKAMHRFFEHNCHRKDRGLEAIGKEELSEIAADPLFELGGHTVSHVDFSQKQLELEMILWEIAEDKKRLEKLTGYSLRWFAYPFGAARHVLKPAKNICSQKGYRAAFTIIPGFVKEPHLRPYQIGRDALEIEDSNTYWSARLAGGYDRILNLKSYLKRLF